MKSFLNFKNPFIYGFFVSLVALIIALVAPVATPNTVVVAFDTAGGSPVAMVNLPGGGKLSSIPSTNKEGYTFEGWFKGDQTVTLQTVFTANTTLRADFEQIQLTIIYETNGGAALANETINYGDKLRLPTPAKTNAVFQGWYEESTLTTPVEDNVVIKQDATFYAKWAMLGEDLLSVSFFSEGLGLIATETVVPNTTITLPTPTRAGYTFQYWVDGDSLDPIETNTYVVTTSLIFFAVWLSDAGLVTITFDTQGGTPVAPIQVPAGTSWQNPDAIPFLAEGYQFLNWITDCNYDGFEVSCVTLDGNYTVDKDMTALARYDYMIPLQSMRFESNFKDGRVIGYTLVSVGDFFSETPIETLILPARFSGLPVVAIGDDAFANISYLDKVIIPENVQFIEDNAFSDTSIKEVFLPNSLLRIESGAFANSTLEKVHFANAPKLEVIFGEAFQGTQLTQFDLPATVGYLGGYSFAETPLSTINFQTPSQLKFIGNGAFSETQLVNVTIPEGVKNMNERIFENTTTLTTVSLPASLQRLGDESFRGTSLASFSLASNHRLERLGENVFGPKDNFVPFVQNATEDFVMAGSILVYYQGAYADNLPFVIPSNTRIIANTLLLDNVVFEKASITLPESLVEIGEYAFASTKFNGDLIIPDGVSIRSQAFSGLQVVGDILIGEVKSIDNDAFSNLIADNVIFDDNPDALLANRDNNVQILENNIFYQAQLESLVVGEGYTSIPYGFTAFSDILTITLPASITEIRNDAIGSSTLTQLTIAGDDLLFFVDTYALNNNALNSPWAIAQGGYIVLRNNLFRIQLGRLSAPYDLVIPSNVRVINSEVLDTFNNPINSIDLNQTTHIRESAFYRWPSNLNVTTPLQFNDLQFLGNNFAYNLQSLITGGMINLNDFNFDLDFFLSTNNSFPSSNLRNFATFDDQGFRILGNVLLDYDPNFDLTPTEVTIPDTIEIIANDAMNDVMFAGPVTLNEGLRYIGYGAFSYSTFVDDSLILPSTLEHIEDNAFSNVKWNDIVIPESVRSIGYDSFYNVQYRTFEFEDPRFINVNNAMFGGLPEDISDLSTALRSKLTNGMLIVDGVLLAYYGFNFNVVVPEGVVNIANNAFAMQNYSIRTITLPSTLAYVGDEAFAYLKYVTSIDFSNVVALRYFGANVFQYSTLKTLTIAAPIEEISPLALMNMGYLTTYSLNLANPISLIFTTSADIFD